MFVINFERTNICSRNEKPSIGCKDSSHLQANIEEDKSVEQPTIAYHDSLTISKRVVLIHCSL